MSKRQEVETWIKENFGIEPNKSQTGMLCALLDDVKRNTIVETTEKLSKDYEGWISPEEASELKSQIEELNGQGEKYADYEELKSFKETTLANEVKQQKLDFLTSRKCKHPDLLLEAIDWSKGKYDSNNKTFTGLDDALENVKGQYADLFETDTQQTGSKGISFILSGSDNNDQNATGTSRMNDFLRGNQ